VLLYLLIKQARLRLVYLLGGAAGRKQKPSKIPRDLRRNSCSLFAAKFWVRIRGGYTKGSKMGLSLMKSMVPAGGIEPTA
jgi:hypothetical protein